MTLAVALVMVGDADNVLVPDIVIDDDVEALSVAVSLVLSLAV